MKRQQFELFKMKDRVTKERLGTIRWSDVFLKIYPYDPSLNFREFEIGLDLTFMQSKIKIENQEKAKWKIAKNLFYSRIFLKFYL